MAARGRVPHARRRASTSSPASESTTSTRWRDPAPRTRSVTRSCSPRLMHGAAQWTTFGALFRGTTHRPAAEVRRARRVGRGREVPIGGLAITGDAMARPLIEALIEGPRDRARTARKRAASRSAVSDVVVVLRQLDGGGVLAGDEGAVPRAVAERVHQRGGGFVRGRVQRSAPDREGRRRTSDGGLINVNMGPTPSCSTTTTIRSTRGEVGRLARGGNVPIGYYKDPVKTRGHVRRGRRQALLDSRRPRPLRGRRHDHAARPRLAVHQLRRREDLSRRRSRPRSRPTRRCTTCSSSACADERWGQKRERRRAAASTARTPTLDDLVEHCRSRIAGYKVPARVASRRPDPAATIRKARLPTRASSSRWRSHA